MLFLLGDDDGAQSTLTRVIEKDRAYSEAHLLMAQIHLHGGNHVAATASLDVGLSYNFQVRDHPIYFLIKVNHLWCKYVCAPVGCVCVCSDRVRTEG